MKECDCPEPNPKPAKPSVCVRCGFAIADRWASSDAHMMRFFNRLSACRTLEETFPAFRHLCEQRELAGRDTFRFAYLDRDNIPEAQEECADLALYPYLELLRLVRLGRGEENSDLLLKAAYHAAMAYDALARAQDKRRHAP